MEKSSFSLDEGTIYFFLLLLWKLHSSAKKPRSLSRAAACFSSWWCFTACCCICEKKIFQYIRKRRKKSSFSAVFLCIAYNPTQVCEWEREKKTGERHVHEKFRQFSLVCVLNVTHTSRRSSTLYFHLFYSLPFQLTKNALGSTHWCSTSYTHILIFLSFSLFIYCRKIYWNNKKKVFWL